MDSAFRLGDWVIEPRRDRLLRHDEEIKVEPRAMQVLVYLSEHAGEVVTREQILEKVWEGTFVSDEVLTSAIRKLRQAFGDDGNDAGFIQTVPRKGYRLNASVSPVSKDDGVPTPAVSKRHAGLLGAVAGLVVGVLITGVFARTLIAPNQPARPVRFTINLPPAAPYAGDQGSVTISSDGSHIAYLSLAGGLPHLYLRPLDRLEARPVAGTATAYAPFFSPDGEWVAFFTPFSNELQKVSLRGGPPLTLCEARFAAGGYWGADETIVFATRDTSAMKSRLSKVSAVGGAPEVIATLDGSMDQLLYGWPEMLPGGKAVLLSASRGSAFDSAQIGVLSLGVRRVQYFDRARLLRNVLAYGSPRVFR